MPRRSAAGTAAKVPGCAVGQVSTLLEPKTPRQALERERSLRDVLSPCLQVAARPRAPSVAAPQASAPRVHQAGPSRAAGPHDEVIG